MRKKVIAFVVTIIGAFFVGSCVSNSDMVLLTGQFEPESLESVRALQRSPVGFKPLELDLFFLSGSDLVEIHSVIDRKSWFILLDSETRALIFEAADRFVGLVSTGVQEEYANPPEDAFFAGIISQTQGVIYANYSIEKGKAYFILGGDAEIFFTPIQLELFLAAIDENLLKSIIDLQIDNMSEF